MDNKEFWKIINHYLREIEILNKSLLYKTNPKTENTVLKEICSKQHGIITMFQTIYTNDLAKTN